MNFLFIIDTFIDGGASLAHVNVIEEIKDQDPSINCTFFVRQDFAQSTIINNKIVGNGKDLYHLLTSKNFDVVHWIRTNSSILFDDFFAIAKDKKAILPPFTTNLMQMPVAYEYRYTLNELRFFDLFIFTVRSLMEHDYHLFIKNKKMIYFGSHLEKMISPVKKEKNKAVVFGRGSSLNKCTEDVLELYQRIKIPDKKFLIAGAGDFSSLKAQRKSLQLEEEVQFFDHLSPMEWLEVLQTIDVFLYKIPENMYSGTDQVVLEAMLSEIPVVFYGPGPLREVIEHGKSGYIAHSNEDYLKYALELGSNEQKRKEMGRNARERILKHFSFQHYVAELIQLSKSLQVNPELNSIPPSVVRELKNLRFRYVVNKLKQKVVNKFRSLLHS